MAERLLTGISRAFWCDSGGQWAPARIDLLRKHNHHPLSVEAVSWFDVLFDGGIVLPESRPDEKRALTLLLTGPPGSGKSSLALELCHRLATTVTLQGTSAVRHVFPSLYITSEASASWVTGKAISFGWETTIPEASSEPTPLYKTVIVGPSDYEMKNADGLIDAIGGLFVEPVPNPTPAIKLFRDVWKTKRLEKLIGEEKPRLVVIDSINTLETKDRGYVFDRFTSLVDDGPRLLVIVIESDSTRYETEYWEYIADIVVRLDREYMMDYLVRTIEIVKARYQGHVWGRHKLKIYAPQNAALTVDERRRGHPYRKEGGIFVYPSIHYYLSLYKKLKDDSLSRPKRTRFVPTSIPAMDALLRGGFPRGRCTGFVGVRGGHKSHLAYRALLSAITAGKPTFSGLILSLRDDEPVVKQTLTGILVEELGQNSETLDELLDTGRIDILSYHPGYITPEEFFHKMYMALHRLRSAEQSELIVLFNSLDQLGARFPLCAAERSFLPGIIQVLSGEGATSWFIAVEEEGQPSEQYGLMSMADAILAFNREWIARSAYLGHVQAYLDANRCTDGADRIASATARLGKQLRTTTVQIVRYAGGQAAGASGMLELVESEGVHGPLFPSNGLHFVPYAPEYDQPTFERRGRG